MKTKKFLILLTLSAFIILKAEYIPFDKAVELLKNTTPKDFPGSNEVFLSNIIIKLDDKCFTETINESYRKILTDQGKEGGGQVFFSEDLNYDSLIVDEINLIKSDGKIISFDPKVLLKKQDAPGWSNIYSNDSKYYTGEIPGIDTGDIIYERSRTASKKIVMDNNFFSSYNFESYTSLVNDYFEIDVPSKIKLYIHELNKKDIKYDFVQKDNKGRTVYSWNNRNVQKLIWESGSEDSNFILHHVRITTVKNWEEISRWYHGIVAPHMMPNDAMKQKVTELIEGADTRQEKASRLFYWVAQNIRYLGVDKEKERPGFEPHDVSFTFDTRGGVCRDKAALLTAMLRLAGVGSDVILILSGGRHNPEAPVLWFNHAITVSYDDKGEPEFIFDPTAETTKDFLPKYEEDNSYIVASEKGDILRTTPVSPPEKNNSTLNIDLKINGNDAEGKVSYVLKGMADTIFRSMFSHKTEHEIKSTIISNLSKISPDIEIGQFSYTQPSDTSKDIIIEADLKISDYVSKTENYTFIPFDASKLGMHFLYRSIMNAFSLPERKFDYQTGGKYSLDTNLKINFGSDPGSISFPDIRTFDYKGYKTTMNKKTEGNTVIINYHFENDQIHYKKEDYRDIKSALSELDSYGNLYMIRIDGDIK